MNKWQEFQNELAEWSDETFPQQHQNNARPKFEHLLEEVKEARDAPFDLLEYADCISLIIDAARINGFTMNELLEGCERKLRINKNRKWGKPNALGFVNHIKDGS